MSTDSRVTDLQAACDNARGPLLTACAAVDSIANDPLVETIHPKLHATRAAMRKAVDSIDEATRFLLELSTTNTLDHKETIA